MDICAPSPSQKLVIWTGVASPVPTEELLPFFSSSLDEGFCGVPPLATPSTRFGCLFVDAGTIVAGSDCCTLVSDFEGLEILVGEELEWLTVGLGREGEIGSPAGGQERAGGDPQSVSSKFSISLLTVLYRSSVGVPLLPSFEVRLAAVFGCIEISCANGDIGLLSCFPSVTATALIPSDVPGLVSGGPILVGLLPNCS